MPVYPVPEFVNTRLACDSAIAALSSLAVLDLDHGQVEQLVKGFGSRGVSMFRRPA